LGIALDCFSFRLSGSEFKILGSRKIGYNYLIKVILHSFKTKLQIDIPYVHCKNPKKYNSTPSVKIGLVP